MSITHSMVSGDALRQRFMHSNHNASHSVIFSGIVQRLLQPLELVFAKDIVSIIKIDKIHAALDPVVIISGQNQALRCGGRLSCRPGCARWRMIAILVFKALFLDGWS